jgi:hypothetical protein
MEEDSKQRCEQFEIFANRAGGISIKQESMVGDYDRIVAVHVDQVELLVKWLREVRGEIIASRGDPRPRIAEAESEDGDMDT